MIRQGRSFSGRERNCVFLNTRSGEAGGSRFANISAVSGLDFPDDARAMVPVDWDHDGDLDVWVSNRNAPRIRFLRNESPTGNRSLQLRLIGNGSDTNRDAVGARVTIELESPGAGDAAPRQLIKTVRAGEGFISQPSRWLHFGLGDSPEISRVVVEWPNSDLATEEFIVPGESGRLILEQGTGQPRSADDGRQDLAVSPSQLELPPAQSAQRIPMVTPVPAPWLGRIGFDGRPEAMELDSQHVTLVNLWSTTCAPCLQELSEFAQRADELKRANIRILALSIDGLENDRPEAISEAEQMVKRLNLPFDTGMAPAAVIEQLRRLHNLVIRMELPLALPTSFLINREGHIDVIYKGPVSVETLLADSVAADRTMLERISRAAAFDGTVIDSDVINSPTMAAGVHFAIAREMLGMSRTKDALSAYQSALKYAPDSALVHNDLGVLHLQLGSVVAAIDHFQQAVDHDPDDIGMRINLARGLTAAKKLDDARRELERAIAKAPENAEAYFNLGLVHLQANEVESAKANYQRALERHPNHSRAHFYLGSLLVREGKQEQAKNHFQSALKSEPTEAVIWASLGDIYYREEDYEAAEHHFRNAVKFRPDNADGHYRLGMVLSQLNRYVEARREFEATLQIDSGYTRAQAALQQTMRALGQ